jgi:hypothetical protein
MIHGVWIKSPIAAVAEITNVTSYGEQYVQQLPPPTSPDAHMLYWCKGDVQVVAVVKGEFHTPTRKYLWASTLPGCKLWNDDSKLIYHRLKTRVWFFREEGNFLRPPFDYGTNRYIGLLAKWEDGPPLPAPQRLGALLFTPSANSDTLDDYADYLGTIFDIPCELVGRKDCPQRLRDLAGLGNPKLQETACGFLKGELGEDCDSR